MFKNVIKEQLKVPAHFDYLGELRDFVTRVGRKHGVNDKIINAFKLGIDEAGTNIIRHAYRGFNEPGFILLRVIVRKASITINLIDQGKYFDPRGVKDPDLQRYVEIGKKGGLGIFIIRKLMDEIDYRKTEEGNELRLTKYFTAVKKRRKLRSRVSTIPVSLKAKYFFRAALTVTAVVSAGYAYFYFRTDATIRGRELNELYHYGERIAALLAGDPQIPNDRNYTFETVRNIHLDNQNKIYEMLVVANDGEIRGAVNKDKWLEPFTPLPAALKTVHEKIVEYRLSEKAADFKNHVFEVYDYVSPLLSDTSQVRKGELHIRILKSNVDKVVATKRLQDAKLAASILLLGYLGAILLIYILLNPFRKLSDWIRALDHGDEMQDEMDIDSSTEIGEIAKAFSDITSRFRESQKNLVEQEQLQKEMQVAQEIQQTLLPSEFPDLAGYEIASHYEAAKEVGGDYYDFVEVDKDTLGIVVADVSGKGVPGSLVMTMIRTALRTEARGVKDAAEVLSRVNDFVVGDMKKGMFVTIFYVIIDSKRRRLNYASAGHNPMILYRPSAHKTYYLNPKGFPIGIQLAEADLFRKSIESDTIQLAEEDILILYTDGITEAMNGKRDLFGEERFLQVIREYGHLRVKPFVERLQLEIESFTEGSVQYDDITILSIKEKTSPEKEELRRAKLAHKFIMEGKSIRDSCEQAGITTYAYYNKYKKQFEQYGIDSYEVDEEISVEAKHISIEEKTKIFDIIRNHPEYGAKRIAEELGTEKYGFAEISENKIYEELVRSRLNTRQLREAFVARGDRSRRRMKPPGTPLLTLDGRVIIDREAQEFTPESSENKPKKKPKEEPKEPPPVPVTRRSGPDSIESEVDMEILSTPIEDLLDRSRETGDLTADAEPDAQISLDETGKEPPDTSTREADETPEVEETESFKELFAGGDLLYEETEQALRDFATGEDEKPDEASGSQQETAGGFERDDLDFTFISSGDDTSRADEDVALDAAEDLLRREILRSFEDEASSIVLEDGHEVEHEGNTETSESESEEADQLLVPEAADADDHAASEDEPVTQVDEPEDGENEPLPILGDDTIEILTGVGIRRNQDSTPQAPVSGDEPPAESPPASEDETSAFTEPPAAERDHEEDGRLSTGELERMERILNGSESQAPPESEPPEPTAEDAETPEAVTPPVHQSASGRKTEPEAEPERPPGTKSAEKKIRPREPRKEDLQKQKEKLLVEGLRYYKRHEFDRAIARFDEAISRFPDFKEAHSILGNAYFRKDLYDKALNAYNRVLALDPRDTTAHENIGVIYANLGFLDKAVQQWENVVRIDPKRVDIRRKIKKALELLDEKQIVNE